MGAVNTFRLLAVLSGMTVLAQAVYTQTPVQPAPVQAQRSQWNGYERIDFSLVGRAGVLVQPQNPAEGRPWIWRTHLPDRNPQVDLALLARGWHVAYMDVANLHGSRRAISLMGEFYAHLVTQARLSSRVVLEGFGRGGMEVFNFAASHPTRVAAIYLDSPVLDPKSWPGRNRQAPEWAEFLEANNLTEQSFAQFRGAIDRVASVAAAKIPIVVVAGDADTVAPLAANAGLLEQRYRERGSKIELIVLKGAGHEPHALPDPAPVVDFITTNARL